MPNGIDKNLVRLAATAAVYRARYGDRPTQARLGPITLWDLAKILDFGDFERLAGLLELRSQRDGISVGGRMGVQPYDEVVWEKIPAAGAVEAAREWLGLRVTPGLDHDG